MGMIFCYPSALVLPSKRSINKDTGEIAQEILTKNARDMDWQSIKGAQQC